MNFNEDGVGVVAYENGANVVRKWLDIKPHKLERKLRKLKGIEHAIHFRMATHGRIAESNVHPFPTVDGGQFMHNGVMGKYTPVDRNGELSDTRIFIRDWLNPMLISNDEKFEDKLRQEIAGNAVLLCAPTGEIKRYGSGWVEHDGCYFSNEYAWDSPFSTSPHWYDTLTGPYSGDQSYTPGKYLAKYNANYAVRPNDAGFNAAYVDERDDTCDDLISADLQCFSDDLDLSDDGCISDEDSRLYCELLDGTLPVSAFLERICAATKLALYCQLARNGKI